MSRLNLGIGSTPPTPPVGFFYLYPKSDKKLYGKNSDGVEFLLGSASNIGSLLSGPTVPAVSVGIDGDFYIDTTAKTIYGPKVSGSWGAATNLVGAPGAAGTNGSTVLSGSGGPSGGTGANGDFYIDTATQTIYGPKTAGVWGLGTPLKGNSLLSGSGAPSGGTGQNGDFYIDTAANAIYGPKTGGVWGSPTPIVGPPGANGTNGTNGTNGNTVLSGAVNPTGGTGVDGDFYINTVSNTIFGPKAGGVWPAGVNLLQGAFDGGDANSVYGGTFNLDGGGA